MVSGRVERAPAKINLTLRVLARRADGYHEIESLVVFAGIADRLSFTPARSLALAVSGPMAGRCGDVAENLVLKAAHALSARVAGLELGRFHLSKRVPVAAGLGGGSSDAAAALRLLARANRVATDDPRLLAAAQATGADVPVCLDPQARVMRGIGDVLSQRIALPRLAALLVNPGVPVATKDVFGTLDLRTPPAEMAGVRPSPGAHPQRAAWGNDPASLIEELASLGNDNDLEEPAIRLQPVIAEVLRALAALPGCRLARMSGSGATCFGLFETLRAARLAARSLRAERSAWWIRATVLGG
ncbi:MAG TPA: 4-(cytidine 5'-diphospho)-2-C-methyl-D-erythritol kinase [Xanthobacteraceae bacterium]